MCMASYVGKLVGDVLNFVADMSLKSTHAYLLTYLDQKVECFA